MTTELNCWERCSLSVGEELSSEKLVWVPGHEGIAGNELADQLARLGFEHPFTGPEPACGISIGAAKGAVGNWLNRKHIKH
jgi:ribonuclease HI